MKPPVDRLLDAHQLRVLGCLLEKEQTTPEYYPLTLKALVTACNQRSNRDPVLTLSEREVLIALERLFQDRMVSRDEGARATRWSHTVDRRWRLDPARKAALTVLLLRGPQTAGEVRGRTGRMHEFGTSEAAEGTLADLAAPPEPLVMLLERDPGQKEPRWGHRLGAPDAVTPAPVPPRQAAPTESAPRPFDAEQVLLRVSRLEQQVQELQAALQRLRGEAD